MWGGKLLKCQRQQFLIAVETFCHARALQSRICIIPESQLRSKLVSKPLFTLPDYIHCSRQIWQKSTRLSVVPTDQELYRKPLNSFIFKHNKTTASLTYWYKSVSVAFKMCYRPFSMKSTFYNNTAVEFVPCTWWGTVNLRATCAVSFWRHFL